MDTLQIIESRTELINEINNLYSIINSEKKRLKTVSPSLSNRRIKFEDLDLGAYKEKFLRILKTLHHRGIHLYLSEQELQKARLISIAGLCEMIKSELTTKFWPLYKSYIDKGPDLSIYNWILEKGFDEAGIKLLRSYSAREFVDSLVLESGVPAGRFSDVLDFFFIYWKYFQHFDDIEDLIKKINGKDSPINVLPINERHKFKQICFKASEFTYSFSLIVSKLIKIFSFLENSEKFSESTDDIFLEIEKSTNINPKVLFRNDEHFKNIINRIRSIITPLKLNKILQKMNRNDLIGIPNGTKVQISSYHYNEIQYGRHKIGGTYYECVPMAAYNLRELEDLPSNEVRKTARWYLLRSMSRIIIKINGKERGDLVKPLYIDNLFRGHIFFWDITPASKLLIRTSDGRIDKTYFDEEEFKFSHIIKLIKTGDSFNLGVHFNNLRLISFENSTKTVGVYSEHSEEPVIMQDFDSKGFCSFNDFNYKVNNPAPGKMDFRVSRKNSTVPMKIGGKNVEVTVKIPEVMLFYLNTYPVPIREGSIKIAGNRFILFVSNKIEDRHIRLKNFEVKRTWKSGEFKAHLIKWEKRDKDSKVEVKEFSWHFELSFAMGISLIKRESDASPFILNENQGRRLKDFEFNIYPPPPESISAEIFLSIRVNNGKEFFKWMNDWPAGLKLSTKLVFTDDEVEKLFSPYLDSSKNEPSVIDVAIRSADQVFGSRRFWIFPVLKFNIENISSGDEVKGRIILDEHSDETIDVTLKDNRGNSRVILKAFYDDGNWHVSEKEFTAICTLNDLNTELILKYKPCLSGMLIGNRITGESEIRKKIFKREIENLDLLINSIGTRAPSVTVNSRLANILVSHSGRLKILKLSELSSELTGMINTLEVRTEGSNIYRVEILNEHFSIEDIKFIPDFSYHRICVTMKISGPQGVNAIFKLFGKNSKFNTTDKLSEHTHICNGHKEEKFFNLTFDPEIILNYKTGLVNLTVVKNGQKNLHPEIWQINFIEDNVKPDLTNIKDLIIAYSDSKRFNKAIELIEKIKTQHPEDYDITIKEIEKMIYHKIVLHNINLVAAQTTELLIKEYRLF